MKKLLIATALIFALAVPSFAAVSSSSVRCGTRLVSVGDTISEVLGYCGSPSYVIDLDKDSNRGYIYFYEKSNRLLVRIYIEDGVVYKILQGK